MVSCQLQTRREGKYYTSKSVMCLLKESNVAPQKHMYRDEEVFSEEVMYRLQ